MVVVPMGVQRAGRSFVPAPAPTAVALHPDVPPPARAAGPVAERILELQRSAGNRAVDGALRSIQRAGGWSDAAPGGWNEGERRVEAGTIRRIPLEGLTLGHQNETRGGASRKLTRESAKGRAIALLPDRLDPTQPVDVLLHFHGMAETVNRPYAGWRERTKDGTVRDVALDRIGQQIEASGMPQLMGLLPQGGERSNFGAMRSAAYLQEVFARLKDVGAVSAVPQLGRLVLGGHSAGGVTVGANLPSKRGGSRGRVAPAMVALFEAINGANERRVVERWLFEQLDALRKVLTDPSVSPPDKEAALASAPRFRAYYRPGSPMYRPIHEALRRAIDGWMGRHAKALQPYTARVADLARVEPIATTHERMVRSQLGAALEVFKGGAGAAPAAAPASGPAPAPRPAPATAPTHRPGGAAPGPTGASAAGAGAAAPVLAPLSAPAVLARLAARHGVNVWALGLGAAVMAAGTPPLKVAANLLVASGVRGEIDLTDALFDLAHPELGGGRIPAEADGLKREWIALRKGYVRPALAAAAPAKTGSGPASAGSAGGTPAVTGTTPSSGGGATTAASGTGGTTTAPRSGTPPVPTDPAAAKKRLEQIAAAKKQAREGGDAADAAAVASTLVNSGTTVEAWFSDHVPDATFLGVPIKPSGGSKVGGVHSKMLAALQEAERTLMDQMPGRSKDEVARAVGLYGVVGLRRPKKATGGTLPSYHCFGLAIDVNYAGNLFLGQTSKRNKVTQAKGDASTGVVKNATLLLYGTAEDPRAASLTDTGQQWERLNRQSEAIKRYLNLTDAELRELVGAGKGGHDLAWWRERQRKDRIEGGRGEWGQHTEAARGGFMDLSKALVLALDGAGLKWGGEYGGGKDVMHFDLRKGTLKR
ncbi:MAG: M15 family metallopeptidase [Actinobacteria bacterium]|nr:M15 family metallopeptidase [Actinomycetota bacterium]